jgi:hypothetical protein
MCCNKKFALKCSDHNNAIVLKHDFCVPDLSVRARILNANSGDNSHNMFSVLNKTWLVLVLEFMIVVMFDVTTIPN